MSPARREADAYKVLRVALRNALLRVGDSDTRFCPSELFRAIESGEVGVGEATERLVDMLEDLGDECWLDGVESTALSFGA